MSQLNSFCPIRLKKGSLLGKVDRDTSPSPEQNRWRSSSRIYRSRKSFKVEQLGIEHEFIEALSVLRSTDHAFDGVASHTEQAPDGVRIVTMIDDRAA